MKILMLGGSPPRHGTTRQLADAFADGAALAGHALHYFDLAARPAKPCLACMHCRQEGAKGCVQDDVMREIYPLLLQADAVVLVTPLYYFGMSAQLKAALDRFFAVNGALRSRKGVKAVLLAACSDREEEAMDALRAHYQAVCHYLGWQDAGMVLAVGAYTPEDLAEMDAISDARRLAELL